jgi:hypothetical protein
VPAASLELFHRIAEPDSAAARRSVGELGLDARVVFRNVDFASHGEALAAHGGATTPALWDGAALHTGLDAVREGLRRALAAGSAEPAPLPPAPDAAIGEDGAPRLGAYAGALGRAALERRIAPGLTARLAHLARVKRWCYVIVVSDDVLAAAAAVEGGYFAGAFAWAVDRRTGAVLGDRSASGLPRVQGRVDDRPADGRARFSGGGLDVEVEGDFDGWRVEVRLGDALHLDAHLSRAAAPAPFTLIAPVPDGGVRATLKAAPLAVTGLLRARGRTFPLDGALGGVDHTAGLLARETAWRWAFALGRAGGAAAAFNLCEGFPGIPPYDAGENAAFAGRAPTRLPPVSFAFDRERPLAPWRVTSADRSVALDFLPLAVDRENRDLGIVRTRFAQVAGEFVGRIPAAGGGSVEIAGWPGVVEDHWALW